MSDFLIDIASFNEGLQALEDSTLAPVGAARIMQNMLITDRGGISPRPGTELLGTYNSSTNGIKGFYNFIKTGVESELLIKSYAGKLEYYHPTKLDWYLLKSSYTSGAEFGFKEHLTNTDNEDYLYFGNAVENYSRWNGATAVLSGAYVSGTTLTVDSTLKTTTYQTGTSTATSATTLDDSTKTWAASQWINFYVLITSGTQSGKISKITANTATQLTFAAITDPGAGCTYQIRMPKFPVSGNLTVGTTTVAYSAIPTSTTFTITDPATGLADTSSVTVQPTEYPAAPKGNRLENHHTRMIVGGVQSGMSRDASGNLQGSQSTATVYVSKIKDATDFTFAAPRVAGEGDLITAPYGGGNITDIANQEDFFYVFKKRYIEADKYATDNAADVVSSTPLKTGFGGQGRVIKGKDDVYFITADNQFTSVSRVQLHDTVPQSLNIGLSIKRLLDTYDFSNTCGGEFKQRILIACKSDSEQLNNNQVIVYNRQTKTFEGIWLLNASGFTVKEGDFFYSESAGANVWKMFTGVNDIRGTNKFGISATWKSHWIHLVPRRSRFRIKPSQFSIQGVNSLGYEGYIKDGTTINLDLYKDFSDTSVLSFTFGKDDSDDSFVTGSTDLGSFLGDNPLGLEPLGSISDPNPDGYRHFKFVVYFPDIYSNYLSLGVSSSGQDQSYEISRIGLGTSEDTMQAVDNIKDVT